MFLRLITCFISLLFLSSTVCISQKKQEAANVIKILAIGNSFSQDAVEYYLHPLAEAEGIQVIIGNLYMAGASLSQHLANACNDKPAYSFRKIGVSGKKSTIDKATVSMALADEDWDYISFQQTSSLSGKYETYKETLPKLFEYVKARLTNPNVKYLLHQTWAYQQNSDHKGFSKYDRDQMKMYKSIVKTAKKARRLIPVSWVIPAGTAIQNGRTSFVGDHFCRDGYHLDEKVGRYTAACAWFETIFNKSVVGNPYKPDALSNREALMAQEAAHSAVKRPWKITKLREFQDAFALYRPVFPSSSSFTLGIKWRLMRQYLG